MFQHFCNDLDIAFEASWFESTLVATLTIGYAKTFMPPAPSPGAHHVKGQNSTSSLKQDILLGVRCRDRIKVTESGLTLDKLVLIIYQNLGSCKYIAFKKKILVVILTYQKKKKTSIQSGKDIAIGNQ